jgi:hypothetical protein
MAADGDRFIYPLCLMDLSRLQGDPRGPGPIAIASPTGHSSREG